MRIVILTLSHLYSNKILKDFIIRYGKSVKLIIEPSTQLRGKSALTGIRHYLRLSGLDYVLSQGIRLEIFHLLSFLFTHLGVSPKHKFFRYQTLARAQKIKIVRLADINSPQAVSTIKRVKPDLIISVLFSQILRPNIIDIPRQGVINFHPAYLPNYKGISPIFWSMVNREKNIGATVHFIDKGIDTGDIIIRRKIPIKPLDTEDSLYWRAASLGEKLISQAIDQILTGKTGLIANKKGSYFSFPTKEAVAEFRRLGKKFFRLHDYLLD